MGYGWDMDGITNEESTEHFRLPDNGAERCQQGQNRIEKNKDKDWWKFVRMPPTYFLIAQSEKKFAVYVFFGILVV